MYLILEPNTQEQLEEYREQLLADNCRILYVTYDARTFGSVLWEKRLALVGTAKEYYPITSLPKTPKYVVCLFDVIGKFLGNEYPSNLELDEVKCVEELPNGWKLSDLRRFYPEPLPATYLDLDFIRLNWYLGIYAANWDFVLIHPEKNRTLAQDELDAIGANTGRERFNKYVESWPVEYAGNQPLEEALDISDNVPLEAIPYPFFRPFKRFNFLPNGRQRFDWELIAKHHRACCNDNV